MAVKERNGGWRKSCYKLGKDLMPKENKGLADTQEGEFVLNESGTTVSVDKVEGVDIPEPAEDKEENSEEIKE